jgi:TfoX/Sxy family transcriptional regulator of competence genes
MASDKEYLAFVMDQLSDLPDITYRAMMGEYVIYYRGKVVAGIYDDRFLIKPTKSAVAILPDAPMEIPYPGGRPMIMVDDIENRELLCDLFNAIYADLPAPKTKNARVS